MTKRQSAQAQVAKLIKADLKSMGIVATAKSSSFSMGDSVRVCIANIAPPLANELESKYSKYEYGSFNSMEDIYEIDNRRDDIPQTKYLSIDIDISQSVYDKALAFCKAKYALFDESHPQYNEFSQWDRDRLVSDVLYNDDDNEFWPTIEEQQKKTTKAVKPNAVKPKAEKVGEVTIKLNTEKNGIEIYFPSKPSATVRADLKLNGFRWSRQGFWYAKNNGVRLVFAESLKAA